MKDFTRSKTGATPRPPHPLVRVMGWSLEANGQIYRSALSSVRAARALLVHASLGELVWAALLVLATLAGALVGTIEKRGSTHHGNGTGEKPARQSSALPVMKRLLWNHRHAARLMTHDEKMLWNHKDVVL